MDRISLGVGLGERCTGIFRINMTKPENDNTLRNSITYNLFTAQFSNFQVLDNGAQLPNSMPSRDAYFDLTTV